MGLGVAQAHVGGRTWPNNLSETLTRLSSLRQHMMPLELAMLTEPELVARRQAGIAALRTGDLATAVAGLPEPNPPALLARYLSAEQALGRVRPDVYPIRAAVTILATLMGLTIMPAQDPPLDPSDDPIAAALLETAADILAKGLAIAAPPPRTRRPQTTPLAAVGCVTPPPVDALRSACRV